MSHYAVLVVTDDLPSENDLHPILLPWHEFESTGFKEYLQWVDRTAEIKAKWESAEPENVYDRKHYETIEQFAEGYFGCDKRQSESGEIQYGRITNPNAKWDWWQIGGRYENRLYTAPAEDIAVVRALEAELQAIYKQLYDDDGFPINRPDPNAQNTLDKIRMLTTANGCTGPEAEVAQKKAEILECKVKGEHPITQAEANRLERKIQKLARGIDQAQWSDVSNKDTLSAFAIVKDGVWHERGKMGWWAIVSDEKAADAWRKEFKAVLETIRPEQWVAVVDCHI